MKRLFVWVNLITGVLPGMIVILHGFGTPEELRMPFGILAAACGLVAFGVVILIKKAVSRGDRRVLAGLMSVSAFIGLGSLGAYWIVLDRCVFQSPQRFECVFPAVAGGPRQRECRQCRRAPSVLRALRGRCGFNSFGRPNRRIKPDQSVAFSGHLHRFGGFAGCGRHHGRFPRSSASAQSSPIYERPRHLP